ncbi:hypothetical protein [Geobacter sp.]|uniref:hypothetical protein n=1 Tax=Geobacter sp. TaxID=46610 RepID=UPI0027BA8F00|nr:hypothetical protein [Geobacter sp.]
MKQLPNKTVAVVARQAATANAFSPLIRRIEELGWDVRTFAFVHAQTRFAENGIAAVLLEHFDESVLWEMPEPALLLTGTSELADEDALFWQWARDRGIPSLAFVDSWIFYWQRFTPNGRPDRKFSYLPDRIAVIDRLMHDRMLENGCPPEHLVITGNPAFDLLRNYSPGNRAKISVSYRGDLVLFVGEPFNATVFGGKEKDALGYTEAEVLALTARALAMLQYETAKKLQLLFLPHPRGHLTQEVRDTIKNGNIMVHEGRFSSLDLAACARAVVGMTSLLLYESAAMGVPSLSIRPNKKLKSDVIESCPTISHVSSSSVDEVCAALREALSAQRQDAHVEKSRFFETICDILRD